jgi:hypothetical protein
MTEAFNEMYVPILDEIGAPQAVPPEETLVHEWETTLPTTLVILSDDDTLPQP